MVNKSNNTPKVRNVPSAWPKIDFHRSQSGLMPEKNARSLKIIAAKFLVVLNY